MGDQLWGVALSLVGVAGFFLAGKKVWWCWYVNIAAQGLWLAYALITQQYGFLLGVAVYSVVFIKNAYEWTRDRNNKSEPWEFHNIPIGQITGISIGVNGLEADGVFNIEKVKAQAVVDKGK